MPRRTLQRTTSCQPTEGSDYAPWTADGFLDVNITKSVNLRELLKPFVFLDYAYGRQKPLIDGEGDTSASLMDAGIGLKFSQGKSFSGNLLVGFPLREKFEQI